MEALQHRRDGRRRRVATALAALGGVLLGAQTVEVPAAVDAPPRPRCLRNTLDEIYCAHDPRGVAVVDDLGSIRCANGECVEWEGEWACSLDSGGEVVVTPDGPACDGGCRAPRATLCDVQF